MTDAPKGSGPVARSAPRRPDPEAMRQRAEAPDAPAELKALAQAVREGKTTWADCVAGKADQLPEVRAVYGELERRFAENVAARDSEEDSAEDTRQRRDADDDLGEQGFLRDAW